MCVWLDARDKLAVNPSTENASQWRNESTLELESTCNSAEQDMPEHSANRRQPGWSGCVVVAVFQEQVK